MKSAENLIIPKLKLLIGLERKFQSFDMTRLDDKKVISMMFIALYIQHVSILMRSQNNEIKIKMIILEK